MTSVSAASYHFGFKVPNGRWVLKMKCRNERGCSEREEQMWSVAVVKEWRGETLHDKGIHSIGGGAKAISWAVRLYNVPVSNCCHHILYPGINYGITGMSLSPWLNCTHRPLSPRPIWKDASSCGKKWNEKSRSVFGAPGVRHFPSRPWSEILEGSSGLLVPEKIKSSRNQV
jgi:hypothetical protein